MGLRDLLEKLDGRPYGHYRDLRGRSFGVGDLDLRFDHVQGDPFAAPSRVSIRIAGDVADLPARVRESRDSRRAGADLLHRVLRTALHGQRGGARDDVGRGARGSGKSGRVEIAALGQEVLERTAAQIDASGGLVLRVTVGLPAAGRRILGRSAAGLVCDWLPKAILGAVRGIDAAALARHIEGVEDQVALRQALAANGLVAFLAQGSVLPRRTGADPRPLGGGVPLEVPQGLAVELTAPHAGRLCGLGIPEGVTLIAGGGYHGKSTLLSVLALAVYDQIPGDGRERCVTLSDAVAIRAEDGRSVRGVDLRAFISDLPMGRSTEAFDSDDASGSTSQAAAIVEALEAGARCLLIDEDTAATNFMIRDARMRRLVPGRQEPITPYLDRVRQLWEERSVSSILVVGGAGDYLDVADTVIQMDAYRPRDVGQRAREVAAELPLGEAGPRAPGPLPAPAPRVPDLSSLDPSRGRRRERVRGVKTRAIEFGTEEIDVSLLAQLVDPAQARMIGDALLTLARAGGRSERDLPSLLDDIDARVETGGIDALCTGGHGDRARARRLEIAAALNRLRSLRLVAGGAPS